MKALYHQEARPPQEFAVLKTHEDASADLGPVGGEAVITRCVITEQPVNGSATLIKDAAKVETAHKPKR